MIIKVLVDHRRKYFRGSRPSPISRRIITHLTHSEKSYFLSYRPTDSMGLCESGPTEMRHGSTYQAFGKVFLTEKETYQEKQQVSLSFQEIQSQLLKHTHLWQPGHCPQLQLSTDQIFNTHTFFPVPTSLYQSGFLLFMATLLKRVVNTSCFLHQIIQPSEYAQAFSGFQNLGFSQSMVPWHTAHVPLNS